MKNVVAAVFMLGVFASGGLVFATVGGGNITMKGGKAGNAVFSHDSHVSDAGIGCRECHPKLYLDTKQHKKVTMAEMQKRKSCGVCHNGRKAFGVKGDCAKCHRK